MLCAQTQWDSEFMIIHYLYYLYLYKKIQYNVWFYIFRADARVSVKLLSFPFTWYVQLRFISDTFIIL